MLGLSFLLGLSSCGNSNKKEIVEKCILNNSRIGYEINVNSFADSNDKDNLGDIDGITEKLDYLKNTLNVDVIMLSPINESNSHHGYDILELSKIKASLGGSRAYKKLLKEAHKRDMYVMLDLVINNTSTMHPLFLEAKKGNKKYIDYYRFTDTNKPNTYPVADKFYYSALGSETADLNYDNPKVYEEILDILKKYLDLGTDGFRINDAEKLYAYDELDTKDSSQASIAKARGLALINKLNHDLKLYSPNTFIMLDTGGSSISYNASAYSKGVDTIYDSFTTSSIAEGVRLSSGQELIYAFYDRQNRYFSNNQSNISSIALSSKKDIKLTDKLDNDLNKIKASIAISMLLPGLSWIYQGDELGISNSSILNKEEYPYKWGDEYQISSAPHEYNDSIASVNTQLNDKASLLSFYKDMTRLKGNNLVLRYGNFKPVKLNHEVASFTRSYRGKTYLIAINTSSDSNSVYYGLNNPKEIYSLGSTINGSEIKLSGYGISVLEVKNVKAPDVEKIIFHYKGNKDYMLYEWSTGTPRWIKLEEDEDGYMSCEINITGLNLSEFEFLIGKKVNGVIESSGKKKIPIEDNGNKVCHVFINEDTNLVSYEIPIDTTFPYKPGQIIKIFAWKTTEDGSFYNTIIDNGIIRFGLNKEIDNINIVIFDSSSPIDWSHTAHVSNDIIVNNGELVTDIIWR